MSGRNPIEDLAHLRHEFGEHGGVNMSVESSSTFTVIDPGTMPEMDSLSGAPFGYQEIVVDFDTETSNEETTPQPTETSSPWSRRKSATFALVRCS